MSSAGLRIAIDAMGGDHAPREIVLGAIDAARRNPSLELILVGREEEVRRELDAASNVPSSISVVDAPEIVTMDDSPIAPLRKKKNSSIRIAANLVESGEAQALISAGNTGAAWTTARKVLGMIDGVSRPALATVFPRLDGHTIMLDVGANVDTKPQQLREFAVMGHFYARMITGIEHPRVGLLSIGEEVGKGNELTRATHGVLEQTGLNFIGNVEGRDLFNGRADVIVCDGFTGNAILKASESLASMITKALEIELRRSILGRIGGLLSIGSFRNLKKRLDYAEYGGAPLLGVKGGCVVCHGSSDARAISSAIRLTADFVRDRIDEKIHDGIVELHTRERASGLEVAGEESISSNL